jgi:hypothetical protein
VKLAVQPFGFSNGGLSLDVDHKVGNGFMVLNQVKTSSKSQCMSSEVPVNSRRRRRRRREQAEIYVTWTILIQYFLSY